MEALKNQLRAERDGEDSTLYDHLTQVVLRLMVERPNEAAKYFESISAEERAVPFPPPADQPSNASGGVNASSAAFAEAMAPLLPGHKVMVDGEVEDSKLTTH